MKWADYTIGKRVVCVSEGEGWKLYCDPFPRFGTVYTIKDTQVGQTPEEKWVLGLRFVEIESVAAATAPVPPRDGFWWFAASDFRPLDEHRLDQFRAILNNAPVHLVSAFLAQHNNDSRRDGGVNPGRDAVEPMSALTSSGSQQGVIAASMLNLRGSDRTGRDAREPVSTLCSGGNHAGLILGFLQSYYGTQTDGSLNDPLGSVTSKARHGLVTVKVGRATYVITDIGMRMLEPEEGAAAHGFVKGSLPDTIVVEGKVVRLTKTQKYHLVGNSVPPEMVRLLAVHNVRRELVALEAAE